MTKQVKSKERVADHGEVFTAERGEVYLLFSFAVFMDATSIARKPAQTPSNSLYWVEVM